MYVFTVKLENDLGPRFYTKRLREHGHACIPCIASDMGLESTQIDDHGDHRGCIDEYASIERPAKMPKKHTQNISNCSAISSAPSSFEDPDGKKENESSTPGEIGDRTREIMGEIDLNSF